jgi:hypothetical protein
MKNTGTVLIVAAMAVAVLLKLAGAPLVEIHRVEHISSAGRMVDRFLHVSWYTYCPQHCSFQGRLRFSEDFSAIEAASFWC